MEQLKSLLDLIATPAQKIVIIDLVNIFNRVNFTGYLYALEGLFAKVENNQIELSIALSNIFEIVTDQCYDVALAFGITLEPNIYIRDMYSIIDAIVSIEEIEDKNWVLTQLQADGDEIDKIVSLLRHHNQTVSEDVFYESISRVKPSVITKLLSITEVSLEEQAQDNFDINPSIKKIISLSKVINVKYKNNESVINKLDQSEAIEHILVHTGQNYDYELNEVFFNDLLLESNFYKGKNRVEKENLVKFILSDPDLNTMIRYESHLANLTRYGLLTREEFSKETGREIPPITFTNPQISANISNTGAFSAQTTPQNQNTSAIDAEFQVLDEIIIDEEKRALKLYFYIEDNFADVFDEKTKENISEELDFLVGRYKEKGISTRTISETLVNRIKDLVLEDFENENDR